MAEASSSPQGLVGKAFEDWLTHRYGGEGAFRVNGRDFDGCNGNRWWEAKSGRYWADHVHDEIGIAKFKSDLGHRLRIAREHGATFELFSNTPIPLHIKVWLTIKGITFTELLE
jgi:filamentous hemagglutinin